MVQSSRNGDGNLFLVFLISNDISNFSFQGKLQSAQNSSLAKVSRSLKGLENLCFCINFEFMQLRYNTVTKFHLTREQDVYCQNYMLRSHWMRKASAPRSLHL